MLDRLWPGQADIFDATDKHMRTYAEEGLRCLLVAYCEIEEGQYHRWNEAYRGACTDLSELEKKKAGKPNKIEDMQDNIERNLTLMGCTAIEDCLQDGVPECIASLAMAGINIWVLTGDKEETAINIAVACNLVLPKQYMHHVVINKNTAESPEDMIALFKMEGAVSYWFHSGCMY